MGLGFVLVPLLIATFMGSLGLSYTVSVCVIGAGDGIVPEAAALSALARAGAPGEVLRVGDRRRPYAHADLFVANDAPADLFLPVARWLEVLSGQVATTA